MKYMAANVNPAIILSSGKITNVWFLKNSDNML